MKLWCINYNQYIQNKNQKQIKYADFKLKEEATRNAKKNKKYFINVIEIYLPCVLDEES